MLYLEPIMIKAGIKIGPYNWVSRLIDSSAEHCEVLFLINRAAEYTDMFQFLERKQIQTCLHFRGVVANNILADPACPDEISRENSVQLIRKCIDIASKNGISYVNIQPGSTLTQKFNAGQISGNINSSRMNYQNIKRIFRESAVTLHEYGQENNVDVLWETPPGNKISNNTDEMGRPGSCLSHALNSFTFEKIAKKDGIFVTNNISHIITEIQSDSKEEIINYLFERTKKLALRTRLLHIKITVQTNNGSNGGNGTAEGHGNNTILTKSQWMQLFELFKNRKGVCAINDPGSKHVQNYIAFKKLMMNTGKKRQANIIK